jgi:hypothetical protein
MDTLTYSIESDGDTLEQFLADIGRFPFYQLVELRGHKFTIGPVRGVFNRRLDLGYGLALLLPGPKLVSKGRVQLHVGPEWLNARGRDELLPDMLAIVRDLVGGVPGGGTISRLDMCTHVLLDREDAERLHWAFVDGKRHGHVIDNGLVMNARWEPGVACSIRIGEGSSGGLRIYDKGAQAVAEGDLEYWLDQWDLMRIPDGGVVLCVEYQLRGDFLRNMVSDGLPLVGVRTLDDLWAVAPDMMGYLTRKWVRLAYPAMGHEHKRELLPLWSVVASVVVDAWGSPCSPVKRVWRRGGASTVDRLSRMALGVAKSLGARMGYVKGYDGPMALETVFRHLKAHEAAGTEWLVGAKQRHAGLVYGAAL